MKILNICSVPVTYQGGSERVILELSKRMAKENNVTILQTSLYEDDIFIGQTKIDGIEIITCKNDRYLGGYGYSKEFKKTLKRIYKDFDIIHIYGYGRFTSNFSMKFLHKRKPFLFSSHGFFHDKKHSIFKKIHNILFSRLMKKADCCCALSEVEKEQYISFGVNENKIKIFPGGITPTKYNFDNEKIEELKKKYLSEEEKEKVIMLYVGRLHESKGIQHVIKSIKNVDVKFLIVGRDAGYKEELEKLIEQEEVKDKVKFVGVVNDDELKEIYAISDFFVLFSSHEGFGIVVIEAMNAGLPVIVSNMGSLPTLVKEDINGYVVGYLNIDELEEDIILLTKNKNLRLRIGENAKVFSQKFDWNNIAKNHLELYQEILDDDNDKIYKSLMERYP